MNFKLELDVKLEVVYDSEKDKFDIISCNPSISKRMIIDPKKTIEHKMTKTQIKFGILTLGSRNDVGQNIPLGKEISLIINDGEPIQVTTHKSVRGRVDGLTRIYAEYPELTEDKEVKVSFDLTKLILTIDTME